MCGRRHRLDASGVAPWTHAQSRPCGCDEPTRPTGGRPPRRQRLPARAHARGLRARHRPGRRLRRARPGGHRRRTPRRPARERDLRDDRRRRPAPSSPTGGRPRSSTARCGPAGSPRTSPSPSCRASAPSNGCRTCARTARPSTGCSRWSPSRRCSTWPCAPGRRPGAPVGVLAELKHATYFAGLGLDLLPPLLDALDTAGPRRGGRPGRRAVLRDHDPAAHRGRLAGPDRPAPRGRRRPVRPGGGGRPALVRGPVVARRAGGDQPLRGRGRAGQGPRHPPRRPRAGCSGRPASPPRPTTSAWRCSGGRSAARTASCRRSSAAGTTRGRPATWPARSPRSWRPGWTR